MIKKLLNIFKRTRINDAFLYYPTPQAMNVNETDKHIPKNSHSNPQDHLEHGPLIPLPAPKCLLNAFSTTRSIAHATEPHRSWTTEAGSRTLGEPIA
jgi:hypothetical protein